MSIFERMRPIEQGIGINTVNISGADYSHCNKVNGDFIHRNETRNGFPVYTKSNDDNICLWNENFNNPAWIIGKRSMMNLDSFNIYVLHDDIYALINLTSNIWLEKNYDNEFGCYRLMDNTNLNSQFMEQPDDNFIVHNPIAPLDSISDVDTSVPIEDGSSEAQIDDIIGDDDAIIGDDDATITRCVICLSNRAEIGILHGDSIHNCMCRTCSAQYTDTRCPVCRHESERRIRVY